MPKRIQRKRVKGYRMPPNTVSITRPGKWGNPFKVGESQWNPKQGRSGLIRPLTIDECLELYRAYVESCMNNPDSWMVKEIQEIRGKNLACFCKEGEPCHGDILLEIANS